MGILHYEPGTRNEVAVVFSCPGRYEESAGKPLAGKAGQNFEILMQYLNEMGFPCRLTRKRVTITNAWKEVEYEKKTGRTEATNREIKQPENIARLVKELMPITRYIVGFGNKANLALDYACDVTGPEEGIPYLIQYDYHLSLQSLNARIKEDIDGSTILSAKEQRKQGDTRQEKAIGQENTRKRLEVIAAEIMGFV